MRSQLSSDAPTDCPLSIREQFIKLGQLEPGWCNGEGWPYENGMLWDVRGMIAELLNRTGAPTPYICPTPEGEVMVEWPLSDAGVLVLFDARAKFATVLVTYKGQDEQRDVDIHIGLDEAGLHAIAETLKPHFADPSRRVA